MTNFALIVKDKGPLTRQSREELKDIIFHQFGIRKHDFYVYCSMSDPYIVIFAESSASDVVFVAGRARDRPIELSFHAWDLDLLGDRVNLPFHIKLNIEGIPQHAWFQEIASKVLCDEAIIHKKK